MEQGLLQVIVEHGLFPEYSQIPLHDIMFFRIRMRFHPISGLH